MSSPSIATVVVDCSDPERLATFWSDLLGRPIRGRWGPYVWLEAEHPVPTLAFQRVPEPKTGKNRVHVDLHTEDVRATERAVLAAGGSRVPGYEDGGFLVLADPEGNEFCVVPTGEWDMDSEGRTDYLTSD